ncbi:GNAT family N-acetyltransferase [Egibacter rhizosphaerae]|uniref:GNAT family N-acetyltransferase n=1 Tax=Egibacter rhizosphaerae TaxID=1670831 RepID=UPI0013F14D3E|nr:GNAT family N-acetyltransferase [Egibacter rhizosphaerae]
MSDLVIRHPDVDELEIVASLTVDAYAEYAAHMSPDAWSAFAHDIANVAGRMSDGEVLVAERAGDLVGSLTRYPNWRGAQEGSSSLRMLAVPPHERGQGVGRALMLRAIELSRAEGKDRVVMTVPPEMTTARDLVTSLGFERESSLDHTPAPGVHAQGYELRL